ncbi:MAG: hypothetical protein ABL907_16685 [Hyphomicrobium sp.]
MSKLKFAILALGAGFLFQGAAVQTANAMPAAKAAASLHSEKSSNVVQVRHGSGRHIGVHRGFDSRHFGGRRHFRHHSYGPRIYLYSGSGYRNGCYTLKRRALNTGSRYWWRRYQACRNGW